MHRKNPAAVELGRKGGSVKSKKKAKSSRENGKKGGRPPKRPTQADRTLVDRMSKARKV